MGFLGSLIHGNIGLRRNLFRRDVETSFYTGKPLPLPKLKGIKNPDEYKKGYPYNFAGNREELHNIRMALAEIDKNGLMTEKARRTMEGRFTFPPASEVLVGKEINWNKDYISGYEWGNSLSWKEDISGIPKGTDLLNAWLPGRLQQLIHLGKGYVLKHDEDYVLYYKQLINDFRERNPFCTGIQWMDAGEVSIRLLNIIFSFPFFIHSNNVDEEYINSLRDFILLHAVYVENNMENEDRGYDYLLNITSLAAAGLVLRDNYYGEKLLRFSLARAEDAVRRLVDTEGISNLRSVPYHPHLTEAFTLLTITFRKASLKTSGIFRERYLRMFDVLAALLRDDGSVALLGDVFPGRILPLGIPGEEDDRFPLYAGLIESGKGTFKSLVPSPAPDILFLYGKDGLKRYAEIPPAEYHRISYGYRKSDLYVLRNNDMHITVDANDTGGGRKKTVGHNDILSFELFYKGSRIIVDPGTYTFYSDELLRRRFRSVKSHNTIYIDDEEPVVLDGIFGIREDLTSPKVTEWHSDEYEDILSVQHYAYTRFPDPVIIKRMFRLLKEKNKLVIRDELFGGSSHQAFSSFIFHPGITLRQDDREKFSFTGDVKGEIIFSTPEEHLISSVQEAFYSPVYGDLKETKKIIVNLTAQFPVYMTTEILLK